MKRLLRRFHELDHTGYGQLNVDEFREALELRDASDAYVNRLFHFFDTE